MDENMIPKESLYNIGVKAVVFRADGQVLALNITRPNSTATYWDLPGGRIIDGESPEDTLRREVQEETGIDDLTIQRHLIMSTSTVQIPRFSNKKVGVVFSIYICRTASDKAEPEERIALHWSTVQEAVARLRTNPDWPAEISDAIERLVS